MDEILGPYGLSLDELSILEFTNKGMVEYALLNPILDELMKEGRIRITVTIKRV